MGVKRKVGDPTRARRRCASCQQKHIRCVYEPGDTYCKPCTATGEDCVIQHRFQHVEPGPRSRSKKQITSPQSDEISRSDKSPLPAPPRSTSTSARRPSRRGDDNLASDIFFGVESAVTGRQSASPEGDLRHPFSTNPPPHVDLQCETPERDITADALGPEGPRSSFFFDPSTTTSVPAVVAGNTRLDVVSTGSDATVSARDQAILLRHFTSVMHKWFDVCDPEQNFRRIVPQKAQHCKVLMEAVCALSAWHLCRQGKFDKEQSNTLYQQCLTDLIALTANPQVDSDDSVLAAAVLLHVLEELQESRGHITGFCAFIRPEDLERAPTSSFRLAAYRAMLRSELHVSFVNQQPLTLPAEVCNVDRTFDPAPDEIWAWRIIMHYRDCLAYSIDPEPGDKYSQLYQYLDAWAEAKPSFFQPILEESPSIDRGMLFPEIWYMNDCHVIGMIHFYLCRIVLAVNNPRRPTIGLRRRSAIEKTDTEVRDCVLRICGIAISNESLPSGLIAASMIITMCAERFTDLATQSALEHVLVLTRELHAWPTEAAQSYVRCVWYGQE